MGANAEMITMPGIAPGGYYEITFETSGERHFSEFSKKAEGVIIVE